MGIQSSKFKVQTKLELKESVS
ncbi:uncharacterized protein G2W53_027903 [Senna tora]|uniref:Uncharacterized protein n=1 Tax=Senna tora TaxID=362788 RepID=A0A834THS3_9FABA|nr:uncharacterized protein G2W53_027903 [Senna tora]